MVTEAPISTKNKKQIGRQLIQHHKYNPVEREKKTAALLLYRSPFYNIDL